MHTLLTLSNPFLVLLAGLLALALLHYIRRWSQRRIVQVGVLAAPIMLLGLGIEGLHCLSGHPCLLITPFWNTLLGVVLPFVIDTIATGTVVLGTFRLLLMQCLMAQHSTYSHLAVQELADDLAKQLHVKRPRILVCSSAQRSCCQLGC